MSMNNQGRPSQPGTAQDNDLPTISGDRGLDLEARLIGLCAGERETVGDRSGHHAR